MIPNGRTQPHVTAQAVGWIIVASLLVHVASLALGRTALAGWIFIHHPTHAAIEMAGAVTALFVARLLLSLERRGEGTSFNLQIAGALVAMGLLDGLHALVHAGNTFVWLHSCASLVGGFLFSLVWVPKRWFAQQVRLNWPWATAGGALALGIASLCFPESVPAMTLDGEFTTTATALNLIGGVLMSVAAVRLVLTFRKTRRVDDLLFCLHCGLFGAAALMFEQSKLWDLAWWGWHVLRLLAYGVAFWLLVITDQRVQREAMAAVRQREESRYRAIFKSSSDALIVLDPNGIVDCNDVALRLFGYGRNDFLQLHPADLLPPHQPDGRSSRELAEKYIQKALERGTESFEWTHQRADGSQFTGDVLLSAAADSEQPLLQASVRDVTARQDELLTLHRMQTAIDSANEAMFTIAPDGRFLTVNRTACDRLGYTRDELLTMSVWDVNTKCTSESWPSLFKELKQKRRWVFETEHRTKHGRTFPVEVSKVLVSTEDTEYICDFVRDISDRKEAERALKESEAKFQQLAKHLRDVLWMTSADGQEIVYVSPAYESVWGRSCESLYQRPQDWADGLHPEDRDRVTQAFYERAALGDYNESFRVIRPDGSIRWVQATGFPVHNATGEVYRLAGVFCDITERKRSEDQLKDLNAELLATTSFQRAVLNSAHHAIIATDVEGVITDFNSGAQRLLGYAAGELVGKCTPEVIHDKGEVAAYARALSEELGCSVEPGFQTFVAKVRPGQVDEREWTYVRKDGARIPVLLSVTAIVAEDGSITGYMGIAQDVTERKRFEHKLDEAKRGAEEANTSKSRFLANMSHEIRTPLNSILGFTDVLRRGLGSEAQRAEHLETIHASGRHLLTLIDDILDLSKIEAGKMEFELVQCSPHEVISDVLSVLRVRAQEKCLRLEARWLSSVPETIQTDPARLRQLLINVVGNAIKFTDKGGVTVTASVSYESPDPRFQIEVQDTGIGIASEQLPSVFDPFIQANSSITRRFGGTGLGMAISRSIARGLGGDIEVESEPGQGSLFRITLNTGPLDEVHILEMPPSEMLIHRPRNSQRQEITLPAARVLLVEDGETNRELIELLLGEAGAHVVSAGNGRQGVDIATRENFDLILMDLQMPVMDGHTATRELRRLGFTLPIIALTANAMRGDRERCLAAGCTGYISKPVDTDELLHTVATALASANQDAGSGGPPSASEAAQKMKREAPIHSTLPVDRPKVRRIVEKFHAKLFEKLEEMDAAFQANELSVLSELAHWLKGAGGTMGFGCFTEPAERLEQFAKERCLDGIVDSLREIRHLASRIHVSSTAECAASS